MVPFFSSNYAILSSKRQKQLFFKKYKKSSSKKMGGPGGKAPWQAGKTGKDIKQVNFLLLGRDPPKNKNCTSIWHRSGIYPASIWHRFGIDLGSIWDRFRYHRGPSGTSRSPKGIKTHENHEFRFDNPKNFPRDE